MELKEKFMAIWKIERFKLIHRGNGEYHVPLDNMKAQSAVLAWGAIHTNPGVFRVKR